MLGVTALEARAGTFLMPAGDGQRSIAYASDGRLGEIVMESWDSQVTPASASSYTNRILYRERAPGGSPGAWQEVVSVFGSRGILRGACLTFDGTGRPMVTHMSGSSGDLTRIQRRVRDAGVWKTLASWDGPQELASSVSVAFAPRADGTMNVLLMLLSNDFGGCSLHHARLPASSGTVDWEALDYFQGTTLNGFDVPNPVYHVKDLPRNVSLAVDAAGALHAVYSNENTYDQVPGGTAQRSNLVYITRPATGEWSFPQEVLTPGAGFGDGGAGASLAIAPDGTVAIATAWVPRVATGSTQGPAELRYLVKQSNGSWASSVVANAADGYQLGDGPRGTGLEPALVFDAASRPWITFADHASEHTPSDWSYAGQVRLATRAAARTGTWTLTTLVKRGTKSPRDFTTWRPAIATFGGQVAVASTSWLFDAATVLFSAQYTLTTQGSIAGIPTITTVTPASGPIAGGTTITIAGTNLLGATVKVGDIAATTVVVNATGTSLTAKTPAGTVGAKTVSVTTAGGTATKNSGFTYVSSLTGGPDGLPSGGAGSKGDGASFGPLPQHVDGAAGASTAGAGEQDGYETLAERCLMLLVETGARESDCIGASCESDAWDARVLLGDESAAIDLDSNGVPDLCQMRCGDLDLSGSIDSGDLALLLTMAGTDPTLGVADLDQDGRIDCGDAAMLMARIGADRTDAP